MITKEILRQIVMRQKETFGSKESVPREILPEILRWMSDDRVLVITGVRRCGKSTLLKQLMEKASGWCYVHFEDERMIDFAAQDFELLNEVLIEVYGPAQIYFFDEIQNVDKFETFVRRLQDEGKKIIITGSNASLLSKEFGTKLTGRYKSFEVYPFSFREFMSFRHINLSEKDVYSPEKKVSMLKAFREYLTLGGLPEYLRNNDIDYVRTVYENILYKDIITRYSIRREKILKELVNILATSTSSRFTYNSLKNTLGLSNAITVKEYISYLCNSYLFFELLQFSYSVRRQLGSPRKIYLVDSAFGDICGLQFSPNKGRILENAVFIELQRKGKNIYYFSDDGECDFVIKSGTKITEAVQVCYALDDSNREREINGLVKAMTALKLDRGLILTFEQREDIHVKGKLIQIMPVFLWLLMKKPF
ncbi:MAG TPA: ATP-binding protein [Candidatus Nanoarchaeia archaeon]|nr:ATP-binding protein [Candidatus Nanoarchaeia archaeon]